MITAMIEPPRPADDGDPASPLSAPLRAQIEQACRGLPATPQQRSWAICRPPQHRVKAPAVGDEVLYRHDSWLEPVPATVEWVQPVDDVDDPHVCQVQTDGQGGALLIEGRPVFVSNPDAWLLVKLGTTAPGYGHVTVTTREARLPGSPGWLPYDWENRWRPMPWEV